MMLRIQIGLPLLMVFFVACGTPDSTSSPVSGSNNETGSSEVNDGETSQSDLEDSESTEADSAQARLPSTGDPHRDTAQEFALDVVQTYFDENASLFESFVHDPLYLAGTNTVYTRDEYIEMMLDPAQFPAGHDLTTYSMDDYLGVYDPGVYTFQEASDNFGLPLFDEDGWVPEDNEYLFVGFFRDEGVAATEEFMAVGLVMFVVAERGGEWKIVGLIPHP